MSAISQTLTVIKRIAIVIGIAIAFSLGLIGAIYLSLRSSETRVPDIVGKDRNAAETTISDAGLNFRVRAERATSEAKPGTVLIQLPHAGEMVKVGQTVAVDISRPTKEGEVSQPANANSESSPTPENSSSAANNSNANSNANKRKPSNRNANANDNLNGNENRTANRNQNRNANRATNGNANSNATHTNTNMTPANRTSTNANANRRPPVRTPTP
ncbi:MAG TPA: PASTA domain-containing protein [Pyrinomonadaceae bacterium]|nr:PASTA domain-containing protein [Pyrinomonadaceae bacterium]